MIDCQSKRLDQNKTTGIKMQNNSLQHIWTFLKGKKTYIIAFAGAIYGVGIQQELWHDNILFDTFLGSGALASIRHGMDNSNSATAPTTKS